MSIGKVSGGNTGTGSSRAEVLAAAALLLAAAAASSAGADGLPPPPPAGAASPWNGDWVLSRTRNPRAIMDEAADGYRFHLDGRGGIRWEIPSLHEVVAGRTDGRPMSIRRPGASGATLAVTAVSRFVLSYRVARNGVADGEGRMTLVDGGRAWVDISQPAGRPDLAGVVIYVRPADAGR